MSDTLLFHPALLPTWGKEVVLGKEGHLVELPCKVSQSASSSSSLLSFAWKFSKTVILKNKDTMILKGGRMTSPSQGGKLK